MNDTIRNYYKRPVLVQAIQFNGVNVEDIRAFVGAKLTAHNRNRHRLFISTLEGMLEVSEGDYVIKGTHGEFYPCKPHIFVEIYEDAEDADKRNEVKG